MLLKPKLSVWLLLLPIVSLSSRSTFACLRRDQFAFAGGFGTSRPSKKNKKGKQKKGGLAEISRPAPTQVEQVEKPKLDRFGLPEPTIDDIFPPMPPGIELIAAENEVYSLSEIHNALKEHIPLELSRFNEGGVEQNPPVGRLPMKVRLLHQSPPVLAIDNFFAAEECLETQEVAMPSNKVSQVGRKQPVQIDSKTFSPLAQSKRTSTSWFCHYSQAPVLLSKALHVLGIPLEQMEEPQIVKYETGQEFSWHYDEVPPNQLQNGGQRLATLLVCLNTVRQGGGTVFRDLEDREGNPLTMQPVQGSALLFFPAFGNGKPDDRTLHKGEIAQDEKRIIQMWIHERSYTAVVPEGNSQQAALEAVEHVSRQLGYE